MKVLQDHFNPFMELHYTTFYLQDGAPCHASKQIKNLMADKPFGITDWPGNSLDLNLIENCWNYLKEKLQDRDAGPLTS